MSDSATIWHCPQCGRKFKLTAGKEAPELCPDCTKQFTLKRRVSDEEAFPDAADAEFHRKQKAESDLKAMAAGVILTTAPTLAGYTIEETIEVLTAECVYGVNAWKELIASFADFFGGRSGKMQQVLRELRVTCLAELRKEAAGIGANAVIGVSLAYSEIGVGKGMSMLMLVASGTAVRIEPRDPG